MKHFSVVLILAVLVSCGGGSSSSSNEESGRNPRRSCGGDKEMKFLCLSPIEYVLNTRATNLPKNMKITATYEVVNSKPYISVALDTCKNPGSMEIVSNSTGSSIFFSGRSIHHSDSVIELIDLGEDCMGNTSILKADIKKEDMRAERTSTSMMISIDLD